MFSQRNVLVTLAVLIVLGVFWGVVWHDLHSSVFFRIPLLDEAYYLNQANEIVNGKALPDEAFFMSPLYPYLVAITGSGHAIDMESPLIKPAYGIRILQVMCWLGVLVFCACFRLGVLFSRALSLLSVPIPIIRMRM